MIHHGKQYRDRAEQVDHPERASVAVAKIHRHQVVALVRGRQRIDERLELVGGRGRRRTRPGVEVHTDQKPALDVLVQCHGQSVLTMS